MMASLLRTRTRFAFNHPGSVRFCQPGDRVNIQAGFDANIIRTVRSHHANHITVFSDPIRFGERLLHFGEWCGHPNSIVRRDKERRLTHLERVDAGFAKGVAFGNTLAGTEAEVQNVIASRAANVAHVVGWAPYYLYAPSTGHIFGLDLYGTYPAQHLRMAS